MFVDLYTVFVVAVLMLWLFASPRDRPALRIIAAASLVSMIITPLFTDHIVGPGRLLIPGVVELLTILALLAWAQNRTGAMQVGLLVVAWLAHVLCYFDLILNTNIVYDRYELLIGIVCVGQLLACHDTCRQIFSSVVRWWADSGRAHPAPIRGASPRSGSLPRSRLP